ncbi:NAD(P)/FAD-dependent oxidoreductase [Streptomyces europaeiscabiei]|uniref:NAD(P)/FAD-dependent oxidoreductase n=1 Tax=Streptomyces europaeiscabiei TaxID=146819 RepID=UPI0029BD0C1E|nr:FAD-dependent oxidoreductase [Streptomyces europaeiscabiei]MDX3784396.1 FAD-dependent oxidoreductase [Streptomyces europaeiscabiei]
MNAPAAPPRNGKLGFWVAQLADKKPSFSRFTGQESVDVAIVGGGYTGLWAAYFAKKLEPSLSVAVFEAEQVGYGASGRNGGWLSAMPPGNRATFARAGGGLEASRALQQEFVAGVNSVLDILRAEGIDADQHKGGALVAAHTRAGLGRLVARRDADLKYGLTDDEVHMLDRDEFRSRINISTVHGGLFYKHCARFHPAKLVYGLADTLTSMGVRICEGSRVDSVEGKTLTLADGRVTAARTFICTEGYSGQLLGRRTLIPVNSSMIVTKPLPEEAWQQIGWDGPQCLNDSAHTFIYAQRTSDGRIAMGGRGVPYRFGSGTGGAGATAQSTIDLISHKLSSFFPGIPFEVDHAWSGVLGVTRDWNGSVHWDPASGIGASTGYAGHGVTSAYVGGRTLVELAFEKETERTTLPWVGYRARKWEPEPIRWLGVHAMYRLFNIADQWEERRDCSTTSLLARFGSRLAGLHE